MFPKFDVPVVMVILDRAGRSYSDIGGRDRSGTIVQGQPQTHGFTGIGTQVAVTTKVSLKTCSV